MLLALLFLYNQGVLIDGVGQVLAHLHIGLGVELVVLPILVKVTVKACLESVAVHDVVLLSQQDTSSVLLVMFEPELGGVVPKLLGLFADQLWDQASAVVLVRAE